MSAVRLVILLWGGLFLALGPLKPAGDGDLWWQRWLGEMIVRAHHFPTSLGMETFASPGAPWVPQEWAMSILVALSMDHGMFWMLALAVSAIPAAILFSIYLRSRAEASAEAIAVALLLCGFAFDKSFGIRAQVLGWGCFAAFCLALERRDRWCYATIPIVVLWANLHASVMIAPVIVLARITGTALDAGIPGLRTSRDVRALPLVLLAIACTPLGWHLPVYAVALAVSPIRAFIEEWQPAQLGDAAFTCGGLLIAILLFLPDPRKLFERKAESLPLLLLFVAMMSAVRNIPLFAIAAAPLAARNLDLVFPRLQRMGKRIAEMEPVASIAACTAVALCALLLGQRHERSQLPLAAIASLAAHGVDRRVFCENFTWCSVALGFPTLRVYMDGRCDPYPIGVWRAYISVIDVAPSWEAKLRRSGADTVIALRGDRFAVKLAADQDWHATFRDRRYVVYVRSE
jgi:hypothetical protein